MSNLQSPTKLTEFAPLSPENRQPGVGFLLSKFFKIKRGSSQESSASIPKVSSKSSITDSPHSSTSDSISKKDAASTDWEENKNKAEGSGSSRSSSITSSQPMPSLTGDGRSLPNVLKRISNLLAMKPTNLQAYEDTEFKQYWMPDSVSKECYECGEKFTTFRRRHHCRVCGQIFCSRCCNQEIPGKIIGCTGDLRVCTYCCKIVLTYLQSSDSGADLSADLRAVQEDLQTKLGLGEGANMAALLEATTPGIIPAEGVRGNTNFSNVPHTPSIGGSQTSSHHHHHHATGSTRRKTSVGYQEERYPSSRNSEENVPRGLVSHGNGKSKAHLVAMRHIIDEMWRSLSLGSHRYHLRTFQSCAAGSDVLEWLLSHGIVSSRVQAVSTAQSLMEAGFLECVSHPEERNFLDEYALYRPRHIPPLLAPTSLSTSSPSSSSSSSSSSSNHQQGEAPQLCPSSSSSSVPSSSPSGSELSPGQVCPGESQEPNWVKQIAQKGEWNVEESGKVESDERTKGGRLPSSGSSFYLDLNIQENKVTLSRPKREESPETNGNEEFISTKRRVTHHSGDPSLNNNHHVFCLGEGPNFLCVPNGPFSADAMVASPPHGWHSVDIKHLNPDNGELEAFQRLSAAYKSHQEALLRQLLVSEGLAQSWGEVVLPLVNQIVELVRPDVRSDSYEMDIRQYVQFKKVPGGNRSESGIISGVVCTKNIAHRAMAARLTNPRILLLGCSVAYQRVEGRFLSLEPLMMQEYDYLKNAVARIASLQPDLLLVEKNVSRLAQDFLLDLGVTLVTNLKVSVLERVAHCTRADIVGSVDAHVGRPRLGTCRAFYLKTFDLSPNSGDYVPNLRHAPSNQPSTMKTLMFFDGCPAHLGCTVILRGASKPELARLKRVVSRMVFIHYSWHLEKSFLMDEFAMPPAPVPDSELFGDPLNLSENSPEKNLPYEKEEVTCSEVIGEEARQKISLEKRQPSSSRTGIKEKPLEERKIFTTETVSDFSDPLQSYLSVGSTSSAMVSTTVQKNEVPTITIHPEIEDGPDEVFSAAKLSVASNPRESNRFRKALDDIVLSSSPFLRQSIPYLDTEVGRNCPLRKYFPSEIYWSAQFENDRGCSLGEEPVTCTTSEPQTERTAHTKMKSNHPFLTAKLTGSINNEAVQALLANFRACGGRITPYGGEYDEDVSTLEKKEPDQEKSSSVVKAGIADIPRESVGESHENTGHWPIKIDALDPFNHQCLPVLLCSYSPSSNNAPYFCVNPWVCQMEFYGQYDIPLGKFLERYCFSSSYLCPSETCDVPMLSHIRRFVHGGGCVQLALKELDCSIPSVYIGTTAKENIESSASSSIVTWSWCQECKTVSPVVPLTQESWSMSFAKYLELRFHGQVYTRRGQNACYHSLHHDHYQYFGMEKMVASFKYTKISPWEISLPQSQIVPRHLLPHWNGGGSSVASESGTAVEENIRQQTSAVVEEIKTLALKGHEVFSSVREKLLALAPEMEAGSLLMIQLQKDQAHFKSKIEQIQLKLTSPTLESKKLEASQGAAVAKEVNDLMLKIEDCVIQVKRLIAEAVSEWNARLSELGAAKKKEEKARRSIEAASNVGKGILPLAPSSDSMITNKSGEENVYCASSEANGNSGTVDEPDESIEADENLEVLKNQDGSATNIADNESSSSSGLVNSSSSNNENKESGGEGNSSRLVCSTPVQSESSIRKLRECLDDSNEIVVSSSKAESEDLGENVHCDSCESGLENQSPSYSSFSSPIAEGLEAGLGVNRAWADDHDFVLIHHNEVPVLEDMENSSGKEIREVTGSKSDAGSSSSSVLGHGRSKSEGDGRCRPPIPPMSAPPSPAPPIHSMSADEQTVTATTGNSVSSEKRISAQSGTVKNILSQLLPSNPTCIPIQCPLNPGEHHLLPLGASGVPVVVYESEPSSVIAYALSSTEYRRCIQEMTGVGPRRFPWQTTNNVPSSTQYQSDCEDGVCTTPTNKRSSNSGSGKSSNSSGVNNNSSGTGMTPSSTTSQATRSSSTGNGTGIGSTESDSGQDIMINQEVDGITSGSVPPQLQQQSHIEVQFNDSSAHFYCRIYFAEQFLALRQHVLPDGEEGYVRSLSRCVSWTARGGKSGSSFYKTKDDRFILKDMSRLEVHIFLNFAPGYFDYMRRTSEHSCTSQNDQNATSTVSPPPTLLGKIMGVYRVAFRNTGTTGATLRTNLLVMENLFYGRGSRVTQRFDLKGSMRNRLVDAAASSTANLHGAHGGLNGANSGISNVTDSEIVLLDENLLKMTCESPLYIQSHSKAVLTRAISNDTLFLSSQSVMDYSLLVGLDEEKKELIVGIIDYIRTFTWDKRLENMVKSAGILGGQGKSPTVVAPELYRGRFIAAMHKYFLPVPDQWTGLGIGIDC